MEWRRSGTGEGIVGLVQPAKDSGYTFGTVQYPEQPSQPVISIDLMSGSERHRASKIPGTTPKTRREEKSFLHSAEDRTINGP